ncbi:MAG: hypothetical protein SV760_04050, partial [Halobacteria archaeon]|nr:hypothetical protein [Halobacteria archaeon]
DAVVPATVETDEVSVAVSTHGSAPAVSRYLRRRIEETVEDENIDGLVRLQDEIREELKREVREQDERSRLLRELIRNDEVRRLLSSDDTDYGEVLGRAREIVLGENDENGDGDEDADKDGDG